MRLYFVSRMMRRRSPTLPAAGMATMSGRGVMTSRTCVTEKRVTASTSRPSFSSCTGGGGTSTGWVSRSRSVSIPCVVADAARFLSAATSGDSARA